MKTLVALSVITLLSAQARSADDQAKHAVYRVPLQELALDGELPALPAQTYYTAWRNVPYLTPRAVLDGEGEVVYDNAGWGETWGDVRSADPAAGFLVIRTAEPRDVTGTLFYPDADWTGQVRLRFRVPAARATATEEDFEAARARHYRRLLERGIPGAAWFRHRVLEDQGELAAAEIPQADAWRRPSPDSDLEESYGLMSGGRALSENLQLDRLLPPAEAGEETVDLASLEGITVREFDWKPLLGDAQPALDPLARIVPADQHAVFFPSFSAMIEVIDEASELGEPLLTMFERRSQDAGTRERYERQLCLPLDTVARAFGPLMVKGVAFTGSDPYLRTGSDVAVLMETANADALVAFVRQRQEAAVAGKDPGRIELEYGDVRVYGVQDGDRTVSSFVAVVDGFVCVSNSLAQLGRIWETGTGSQPRLADAPEYRFFRQRYERGAEDESALIIVPDAAIRRWCGPRWRIAASRRTRAAAVLADLTAEYVDGLARGVTQPALPFDERFPMGDLSLTADGVRSSIYGRLAFQTPIAELEIERVSKREADLYRRWRDGYQANWSRYFDPIAARVGVAPGGLGLDLTVMPLIVGTEYRELRGATGTARLGPGSGDPHDGALMQFVMAIDPDGEVAHEMGAMVSGMMPQLGAEALAWMGGSVSVYLDRSAFMDEIIATEDLKEAEENLLVDLNEIPLVVHVEVASGLRLAAFLGAIRAFAEQTSPGILRWDEVVSGEHHYVRVGSEGFDADVSVFYATTPSALILSLNEETLVRALDREKARRSDEEPMPAPWAGESVAFEIDRAGLRAYQLLETGDLREHLRHRSWDNLPILNEWKRRFPDRDPVAVHAALWGDTLECPGGGKYVWNAADGTMESTVFGHPGDSRKGVELPPALEGLQRLSFGLTFEHDGLRSRVDVSR